MRILDPYAVPGAYRKAQLHCHTRRSDGAFEPADLARRYRDAGYSFVCFTDHDRITRCDEVSTETFLVVPGIEETIVWWIPPLGPHLGRLVVDEPLFHGSAEARIVRTLAAGGVPVLHHPSWNGNLWTGAWPERVMTALPGPYLVEIWNPHSRSEEDVRRWAQAVRTHGPGTRIGATASDDFHDGAQFNRAWVTVKTEVISAGALRDALLGGAFYASTGVDAEFGAEGDMLVVRTTADEALIIDASGRVRATISGGTGRYTPSGDEGFVRVECRAGPRRAWSQAFWIISTSASAMR
ncbi:MAG: PHP domain-containing protein [Armatimonadota bacterium]